MTRMSVEWMHINKHVRQRNREAGEFVLWYELVPFSATGGSTFDDLYDEDPYGPGGRVYSGPIRVPTIYVEEKEDRMDLKEDGRQPTMTIDITMLYDDVAQSGLSTPFEYQSHLNDLVEYDGRTYEIRTYNVRGRTKTNDVLVAVTGFELYEDQERPNTLYPEDSPVVELPWPSAFPS